jgi:hypothetical protein
LAFEASGEGRFGRGDAPRPEQVRREHNRRWYWLLLVPFVGTLLPWIYNTSDPELIGMPFFYWYQLVWIPISVCITYLVYSKTRGG